MSTKTRVAATGDLLTTEQAVAYLRLAQTGTKFPERALHRYRRLGRVRGVRVGMQFLWPREELDAFIAAGLRGRPA